MLRRWATTRSCESCGRLRAASVFQGLVCVLAGAAVLAVCGCRPRQAGLRDVSVHEEIAPTPVREGPASVVVRIANAQGAALTGAHVSIEGDMAHPGMAPVFGDATETAPGRYEARIDFNMPGDWVVLEHIRLADGRRIERQVDVKGVAGR